MSLPKQKTSEGKRESGAAIPSSSIALSKSDPMRGPMNDIKNRIRRSESGAAVSEAAKKRLKKRYPKY